MKINQLREKYPEFIYKDYQFELKRNDLILTYLFEVSPNIKFRPTLKIRGVSKSLFDDLNSEVLNNFVFHLGMMEIPSYWKATCSPRIVIQAGYLDSYQINWWKDLLINGMGQFFYKNKIDFRSEDFVKLEVDGSRIKKTKKAIVGGNRTLVPVGGGKDSVVTLELLKKSGQEVGAFIMNPTTPSSEHIIKKANIKKLVVVDRKIDDTLLRLNSKGYLNGHTPFTAILHFVSTFVAYIFGYKNVAFSNERSADEGNIVYLGKEINHQYSKTFEFEEKFRRYNSEYLTNINVFSFLRPLHEIQISKVFLKMDKYFSVIRSCNVGQKTNIWCCACPKCLSTFILLHPFLGSKKIAKIFPRNLFENQRLFDILKSLVDQGKVKPFECVGTREEIKVALQLSIALHRSEGLPKLLKLAKARLMQVEGNLNERSIKLLSEWDLNNNLSKGNERILRKALDE